MQYAESGLTDKVVGGVAVFVVIDTVDESAGQGLLLIFHFKIKVPDAANPVTAEL